MEDCWTGEQEGSPRKRLDKNSTYGEGRLSAVLGEGTWHELLFNCGFQLMNRNNNKFCNLILAQDNLHV